MLTVGLCPSSYASTILLVLGQGEDVFGGVGDQARGPLAPVRASTSLRASASTAGTGKRSQAPASDLGMVADFLTVVSSRGV